MDRELYAVYKSSFGRIKISYNNNMITKIKIIDSDDCTWDGVRNRLSDLVFEQIEEYFAGERTSFDFPYKLNGTDFQKKVWQALIEIPYGETRKYKEIATKVGNPNASRAVGMANNKNLIMIVVPCHRVVGSGGKLVGYAGGLLMKRKLLEMENKHK